MSRKQDTVVLCPPIFGTGTEQLEEFTGYSCGRCHGNGYFLDPDITNECVKIPCPGCGGTGQVKGIVTVEWRTDGEIKPYFKEE